MSENSSERVGAAQAGKSRKIPLIIGALAFLSAAGFGVSHYLHVQAFEDTDDAFLEGRVVPVSGRAPGHVLAVRVTDNQLVKAGDLLVEIDPRDYQLKVERAKANLKVAEARAEAAQKSLDYARVFSGAGIDEASSGVERAAAGVDSGEAAVRTAQARLEMYGAQLKAAEAAAEQARAQVAATESEAKLAEADLKRFSGLFAKEMISAQQMDQAANTARSAAARLQAVKSGAEAASAQAQSARAAEASAREGLSQARAQAAEAATVVGQAKSRLAQARGTTHQVAATRAQLDSILADAEQARAAVKQAELELSYTRVLAPEAGRVTRKMVEPGAFIQTGQALLALVPADFWVVANFKETQLARMKPGQPATVVIDAFPGKSYRAHVDSIQTGTGARFSLLPPENASGNYVKVVQRLPVKLVFDEQLPPELPLGPGMSVAPEVRIK